MFIIMAAFFFALMSFFIRLSGDLPTMQKSFFRNAVASVAAAAMLGRSKEKFRVRKGSLPWLLIRSAAGTVGLLSLIHIYGRRGEGIKNCAVSGHWGGSDHLPDGRGLYHHRIWHCKAAGENPAGTRPQPD